MHLDLIKFVNSMLTYLEKENIKVLPYEMLVNDPSSYYKEICDFIDEPYDDEFINQFINIKDHQRKTKGYSNMGKIITEI